MIWRMQYSHDLSSSIHDVDCSNAENKWVLTIALGKMCLRDQAFAYQNMYAWRRASYLEVAGITQTHVRLNDASTFLFVKPETSEALYQGERRSGSSRFQRLVDPLESSGVGG